MLRIRRSLPLLVLLAAMGAAAACSDPMGPRTPSSVNTRASDDTTGKICVEIDGEIVCFP